MKKKLFVVSIVLIVCQTLKAQFATPEDLNLKNAENLKNNTLVIVLLSEDEKYISKLAKKNPKEIEHYQHQINSYNSDIQSLVPKLLHISKEVKFKTLTDIELMTFEDKASCTFMLLGYCSSRFTDGDGPRIDFHSKKGPQKSIKEYYALEHLFDNNVKNYLRWEFYSANSKGKLSELIFYKNLPNTFVSKSDIVYGLDQTQLKFESILNNKTKELDPQVLKSRTLLINKNNLDENTTENEIRLIYPYKIEVVSQDEFEKALIEKNPKYCHLIVVPLIMIPIPMGIVVSYNINYCQQIIDSENGFPISFDMAKAFIGGGSKSYFKVTAGNFEDLNKKIK